MSINVAEITSILKQEIDEPLSGAARVFAFFRDRLLTGELKVGDRLLGERELSLALGVSRPALVLQPQNLLDAMYLQLAKFVAGDGVLRTCKQCGEWFECGATESRRSIALFCSERCKNRFHYLERAKR